jgi:FKBP-type peptidyl-prolyl cis-trans isomerase SlyD
MSSNDPLRVADDLVVTMAYKLSVDGEVIEDSESEEGSRIEFIQGAGLVLPALEEQLYGLSVGDQKEVTLQPEDGYGLPDPDAFADVPRSEFPTEIPVKPGIELQLKDEDGEFQYAVIESVDDQKVRLNFNHQLAGKVLEFSVHIVGLRTATPEELEHGHVHDDEHHH